MGHNKFMPAKSATAAPAATTILGIETSCDETAVALVAGGTQVLSSVVASQVPLHREYGGVVPEVASRAHLEQLLPVTEEAFRLAGIAPPVPDIEPPASGAAPPPDIAAVAATAGPGLVGALLVGVSAGKALSLAWDVPFVAVNHLEGHIYAAFLEEPDIEPPLLVLLVSGGHTMLVEMTDHGEYRLLGQTADDAAGEAFDKVARLLGLGYPGGPEIDRLAGVGDPEAVVFPRPMMGDGLDFSFSGLKTAVANYVRGAAPVQAEGAVEAATADIAASFQQAVVDVLVAKAVRAVQSSELDFNCVCLAGGVAANSALRDRFGQAMAELGVRSFVPSRAMCTDNAAMIASAGWWQLQRQGASDLAAPARPSWPLAMAS